VTVEYKHLVGEEFLPGVRDCLAIVRRFYSDNFGIEITDYARPHDWSADNLDLIRLVHEREGFQMLAHWKVNDLRPADILCLSINESNPNHMAIYVGDNMIVHHLWGRRSADEMYRDFYRNSTAFVLRHPDVPDLRPVRPDTTIRSLLNDRYRVAAAG
jgi:cell wall-associated NlpC family hydrolase